MEKSFGAWASKLQNKPLFNDGTSQLQLNTMTIEEQPTNVRKSTVQKTNDLLLLGFFSLGSIYGDIGTSPLYVMTTIFNENKIEVTESNVFGAVSCIFWLFTIVVIVKYCLFVLTLGPNNGEGGQVAIYCKLARTLRIHKYGTVLPSGQKNDGNLILLSRSETVDSRCTSFLRNKSSWLDTATFKRTMGYLTMSMCFLGFALVISDGLLTPTTSVLSAVEGLSNASPALSTKVVPLSIVILVFLFAIQPFGSKSISYFFSPLIVVWFLTLLIVGGINISSAPRIFKCLSPVHAIQLLKKQGDVRFLGAVMLAITGVEAMFADVGHFTPLSVQVTLFSFVYPSLMICYLGQGAFLLKNPDSITNVFYDSIPGPSGEGFYWFVFTISIMATIIASQALILGVFSICKQMISIGFLPQFKVIHKSAEHRGRIFIPSLNIMLMFCVIACCIGFRSSANVTAAYGLGVSLDIFLTTILITLVLLCVKRVHLLVCLAFFLPFASLECCLIISNMSKVPHGAWFTLMSSAIVLLFTSLWTWCNYLKSKQDKKDRIRLNSIILEDNSQNLDPISSTERNEIEYKVLCNDPSERSITLKRYHGTAILYTELDSMLKDPYKVPKIFKEIVTRFPCIPNSFLFVAIRVCDVPFIEPEDRFLIQPLKEQGFYCCMIRMGFMESTKKDHHLVHNLLTHFYANYNIPANQPVTQIINIDRILAKKASRQFLSKCLYLLRKPVIEYFFAPLNMEINAVDEGYDNAILCGRNLFI